MQKTLYEITAGEPKKLLKPILLTSISELINFMPTILIFWIIEIILESFLNKTPPNAPLLVSLCALLIAFMVVMFVFEIFSYKALYKSAYEVSAIGRIDLAKHLTKVPLGYLDSNDTGSLAHILMNNYAKIEIAMSHKLPICIANTIVPIVVFIALVFINWEMALAMFICLPLSLLFLYITQNILNSISVKQQKAMQESANRVQEYLDAIILIKAYNLIGARFKRLLDAFKTLNSTSLKLEIIAVPFVMLSLAFVGSGIGIMIITGRHLIFEGALDIFTFIAFLMIGTKAFVPFSVSAIAFAETRYFQKAGKAILDIKNIKPEQGKAKPPKDYDIVFENVSFAYQNSLVLKNISFAIPKNKFIAITGPSGGGKSTILKLIARFYAPSSGKIYFGGKDIQSLQAQDYLKNISMVSQDVFLFSDSIKNNIALGDTKASLEEIMQVCQRANCTEFISKMQNRLQTQIQNTGKNLSGGQKQRISIARALLKNAPIIALDEFSAALDSINELKITQAISELIKQKTLILIAHRLNTIINADCILYIDKGEIKEQGTHEELLNLNQDYAKMWRLQNEGGIQA